MRARIVARLGGARRLPAVLWALCLALAVATLALLALAVGEATPADSSGFDGVRGLSFVVASLAFATVGAMVASRVPGNPIGWIFCLTGLILGASDLAFQYADRMLFIASDPLSGGRHAAWLADLGQPLTFGLLGLALLLFPDGRLPSGRWRPVRWLAIGGMGLILVGSLRRGELSEPFTSVSNPFGVAVSTDLALAVSALGFFAMVASVGIAALGIPARLRRARGIERDQLKWLALAAAVSGVAVVADVVGYFALDEGLLGGTVLLALAFTLFPLAAGAAILRHRLYDIDLVINRGLVYGALTAILAGAYLGSVLLLGLALAPLTSQSDLAIALSTLAVAALFGPARRRVQTLVDRRFYRRKYDAARTLERFGALLRAETDLEALRAELTAVVSETMQPAHVSLWLRDGTP